MSDNELKADLIQYFGYSDAQAEWAVITYACLSEIDDLIGAVEEKKKSLQRL